MKILFATLLAAVAFSQTVAFAQPPAGAKSQGRFDFYGRAAGSAMRGARERTNAFREYVRSTELVPTLVSPRIAQVATDEIGDSIRKAEKYLEPMRRQAETQKDKETIDSLDSIGRSLAVVKQTYMRLCNCCLDDDIEKEPATKCCQTIEQALSKAIAEHEELMKRLGEKQPAE